MMLDSKYILHTLSILMLHVVYVRAVFMSGLQGNRLNCIIKLTPRGMFILDNHIGNY